MFITLLEELQEQIISHCPLNDVKNFSLTDSHHRNVLRKYIMVAISVPPSALPHNDPSLPLAKKISTWCHLRTLRLNTSHHVHHNVYRAIGGLPALRKLDLSSVKYVTDRDLGVLTESHAGCGVKELWLCKANVTSVGVARLTMLNTLSLVLCSGIGDDAMEEISKLTNLRSLRLIHCDAITGDGLALVCKLTNLRTLRISLSRDTPEDGRFDNLGALVHLEDLSIRARLSEVGFQQICSLPKLKILTLICPVIYDWAPLGQLTGLRELLVGGCCVRNEDFTDQVVKLNELAKLDISNAGRIPDHELSVLKRVHGPGMVL